MKYEIRNGPTDKADFSFYGTARNFATYQGPEAIIHGPAECLAGETKLFIPSFGDQVSIQELYERDKAFDILTLFGPAKAEKPFIKGYDRLYRIVTSSGNSFLASKNHKVMTDRGWTSIADLYVGERLPEFVSCPLVSNLEHSLSMSLQDDPRLRNIVLDSPVNYPACHHSNDAQPHRMLAHVQSFVPLPDDAYVYSRDCPRVDALSQDEPKHNHLCQSSHHPSSSDYSPLFEYDQDGQSHISQEILSRGDGLSQRDGLSLNTNDPLEQDGQQDHNFYSKLSWQTEWPFSLDFLDNYEHAGNLYQAHPLLSENSLFAQKFQELIFFDPLLNAYNLSLIYLHNLYYTVQWSTVSSIEFEREDIYFDLHVPFFEHYIAEGCLHHNTGKTISALMKLHICACKYPGASIVIARKTLASTYATVLQTFQHKVLDDTAPVRPYGGEKPEWFDYLNGSRIWMAGLDKSSKVLSSEHDIIYCNQVEELGLDDWETLTTRTTGRAGNMPYSQTIGDANPSYPQHWMYHRSQIKIFYSVHRDNPALYDQQTGDLTKQGKTTIDRLKSLTGMRRIRLYEGKPAQAEGVIYEDWNEAIHYIYSDKVPQCSRFVGGQDWGFTHPGVLGIWAIDGDGRMYLVAQIYRTKKTVNWWTKRAVELNDEFGLEAIACGPDQPAYIEQYQKAGINAIPADNSVLPGINAIQQRLKEAGDGKPRLYVVRDSFRYADQELIDNKLPYRVEDEFPSYVWANSSDKEKPVKKNDDGMDMARYATMYVDEPVNIIEVVRL